MRLLIQHGRLIDPAAGLDDFLSLLIEDGLVVGILTPAEAEAATVDETVDATGLIVCPGFVDSHVALREPGFEDDETVATGTASALVGGFTTIAAMPDTNPVVDNRASAEFVTLAAQRANNCRVLPLGAVTQGHRGEELAEIGQLVEAGAVGFTDAKRPIANAEIMRRALEYTGMFGKPILHHAVVAELAAAGVMHEGIHSTRLGLKGIPAAAQDIMTGRDIALAEVTGGHVHLMCVTTEDSVDRIGRAREHGIRVTADVAAHHLLLTDECVATFMTHYKVDPPLRSAQHVAAMIEGLKNDTIDAICSDHQPLANEKKDIELDLAPSGLSTLETVLPVCVEALIKPGHLDWPRLIAKLTSGPASAIGIEAGTLRTGQPADVTLIDPCTEYEIHASRFRSKSHCTPFDGMTASARVIATFVGGERKNVEQQLR